MNDSISDDRNPLYVSSSVSDDMGASVGSYLRFDGNSPSSHVGSSVPSGDRLLDDNLSPVGSSDGLLVSSPADMSSSSVVSSASDNNLLLGVDSLELVRNAVQQFSVMSDMSVRSFVENVDRVSDDMGDLTGSMGGNSVLLEDVLNMSVDMSDLSGLGMLQVS